jgi:transposase
MQTPQLFIGIDVHKKSWSVSIRTDLFEHKTFNMPSEPDKLIGYVNQHFKDYPVECCYEASCCGFAPYRELAQAGWKVKVLNPSDIPQSAMTRWIVETWQNSYKPATLREYTYLMSRENSLEVYSGKKIT